MEDHLGDRLRGRAIPDDLRRLVELELDGVLRGQSSVQPFAEVHVLYPGQLHPLQDPQYQQGEPDSDVIANIRAIDGVLVHMAVVVDGFNDDLFGYWLHLDEPATDRRAIVKLDTEGQFAVLEGDTLVEAMVFDWLGYDVDQDYFARIVAFCQRHQIPLAAAGRDELRKPETAVDPGVMHDQLYRRYQPFTTRPPRADTVAAQAAADEHAAPVGLRITDAPLRTWLARLGYPDPAATVAALDDGLGEVRLEPAEAHVDLTLYQDEDRNWWLFFGQIPPADAAAPAAGAVAVRLLAVRQQAGRPCQVRRAAKQRVADCRGPLAVRPDRRLREIRRRPRIRALYRVLAQRRGATVLTAAVAPNITFA